MDLDLARRKAILDQKIKAGSDSIRSSADEFLQDKIVNPLYQAGYENLGPAIGAAGSALVNYATPESTEDIAMSLIPGGKQMGMAGKGMSKTTKTIEDIVGNDPVKIAEARKILESPEALERMRILRAQSSTPVVQGTTSSAAISRDSTLDAINYKPGSRDTSYSTVKGTPEDLEQRATAEYLKRKAREP